VAEWKRSGKSAAEFAAERGIARGTLSWWGWHLKADARAARRSGAPARVPRLVRVEASSAAPMEAASPAADSGLAWELRTRDGDALRVHGRIGADELSVVLAALTRSRGQQR
jgi:hypothetical protein